jgi:hypothetical protein
MLCSLRGLFMLAYCAACRIGILHGCRVRIPLLGFGAVRLLMRPRGAGCLLCLGGRGPSALKLKCVIIGVISWLGDSAYAFPLTCQHCTSLERHLEPVGALSFSLLCSYGFFGVGYCWVEGVLSSPAPLAVLFLATVPSEFSGRRRPRCPRSCTSCACITLHI